MAIIFTVTAGYFQVQPLAKTYLMRKDTCVMDRISGAISILSSSVFRFIERYTDACFGGEQPCYVKDPQGEYYYDR